MLLITAIATGSIAILVTIGSSLIVQDKTAYIYDYVASRASSLAKDLNSILEPVTRTALNIEKANNSNATLAFKSLGEIFNLEATELPRTQPAPQSIDLVRTGSEKGIGITIHLSNGRNFAIFRKEGIIDDTILGSDFSLCVISKNSNQILYSNEAQEFKTAGSCKEVLSQIKLDFEQGTNEIILGSNKKFLLGYHAIMGGAIVVTSLVAKRVAFESANVLIRKSVLLGLAIFFLSLGISILILRAITARIDELTKACLDLAQGNFETNLKSLDFKRNEIAVLTNTFLTMVNQIKNLIVETAARARMQNELEAAELVQRQLLPQKAYQDEAFEIEGLSRAASECGGDFWQFKKIDRRIFFIFGDVTGHGVPAALVTASIFGAFSAYFQKLEIMREAVEPEKCLRELSEVIHHTIYASGNGESWFSCVIGALDSSDDSALILNHSHPLPLYWRGSEWNTEQIRFRPAVPLGAPEMHLPKIKRISFGRGSRILLYSDGLFDQRTDDYSSMNKSETLDEIDACFKSSVSGGELLSGLMAKSNSFFGKNQPDDITLLHIIRKPNDP